VNRQLRRHERAVKGGHQWALLVTASPKNDRTLDGHEHADARRLADLLAGRGDLDYAARLLDEAAQLLRARADAGDDFAARELAGLLCERGDLDELLARINAGDRHAARRLGDLLIAQGRDEEVERLWWVGLEPDGSIAWA
jgi:hypothetical protein